MSNRRIYRVLVRVTQTHFIDRIATNGTSALEKAERCWYGRSRSQLFEPLLEQPETDFHLDELADVHFAESCNEDRAGWAEKALRTFSNETGATLGEEALHDLLCDLGHYADQLGLDYKEQVVRAVETWVEEKAEEQP